MILELGEFSRIWDILSVASVYLTERMDWECLDPLASWVSWKEGWLRVLPLLAIEYILDLSILSGESQFTDVDIV